MGEKLILGCAWCERQEGELAICCRRHVRLVCDECRERPTFVVEHQPVAQAS